MSEPQKVDVADLYRRLREIANERAKAEGYSSIEEKMALTLAWLRGER